MTVSGSCQRPCSAGRQLGPRGSRLVLAEIHFNCNACAVHPRDEVQIPRLFRQQQHLQHLSERHFSFGGLSQSYSHFYLKVVSRLKSSLSWQDTNLSEAEMPIHHNPMSAQPEPRCSDCSAREDMSADECRPCALGHFSQQLQTQLAVKSDVSHK